MSMFDVTPIKKWPDSIPGNVVTSFVVKLHSLYLHINYLFVRASNYNTLFYKLLSKADTRVHTSDTEYVSLSWSNSRAQIESSKKVSSMQFSFADPLAMPVSDLLTPEVQSSSEELKQ